MLPTFVLLFSAPIMDPTDALETTITITEELLNTGNNIFKLLLSSLVIILALLIRKALQKIILRQQLPSQTAYFWNKAISYGMAFLAAFIVGGIWLYGVQNVATFLGLLSAGIALALREPIINLAGWLFILFRQPLSLGDRIEIDNIKGDVIDLGPFFFSVLEVGNWVTGEQSTGRIIHIPNVKIFTSPVANYTQQFPYIWDEVSVMITFESNWEKAKRLLEQVLETATVTFTGPEEKELRETATRYYIKLGRLTPVVYTSVADSGVLLTMRYLTPVRQRRSREQLIWEEVLRAFSKEDDIDLAYHTERIFYNPREGKPGAGGPKSRSFSSTHKKKNANP